MPAATLSTTRARGSFLIMVGLAAHGCVVVARGLGGVVLSTTALAAATTTLATRRDRSLGDHASTAVKARGTNKLSRLRPSIDPCHASGSLASSNYRERDFFLEFRVCGRGTHSHTPVSPRNLVRQPDCFQVRSSGRRSGTTVFHDDALSKCCLDATRVKANVTSSSAAVKARVTACCSTLAVAHVCASHSPNPPPSQPHT